MRMRRSAAARIPRCLEGRRRSAAATIPRRSDGMPRSATALAHSLCSPLPRGEAPLGRSLRSSLFQGKALLGPARAPQGPRGRMRRPARFLLQLSAPLRHHHRGGSRGARGYPVAAERARKDRSAWTNMHLGNPDLLSQTWAAFRLYTGASSSGLFPGSPSRARTGGLLGRPGGPAAGRAPILLHQAAAPERRAPVHRRQPGDSDNGPASSLRAWGAAARPSPGERAPAQDFKPAYSAAQRLGRRRRLSIPAYPPHPRGTMVRAGKYLSHHYVIKLLASRLMPLPSRSRIPRQSTSRSSFPPAGARLGSLTPGPSDTTAGGSLGGGGGSHQLRHSPDLLPFRRRTTRIS